MGRISTWACFWLLLMLFSLVGNVSSLSCYTCTDEKCKDKEGPFNSLNCKDSPNAACLLVIAKVKNYYYGFDPEAVSRSCAHGAYIGKLDGATEHCKLAKAAEIKEGLEWLKTATPDKKLGGEEEFEVKDDIDYVVCACTLEDKCNEGVHEEGHEYTTTTTTEKKDDNNGNNNGNNNNGGGGGFSGAGSHFLSTFTLGGVIILSVWRAVHNHNHMDGF